MQDRFFSTENFDIIRQLVEGATRGDGVSDGRGDTIQNEIFEAMQGEDSSGPPGSLMDLNKNVIRKVLQRIASRSANGGSNRGQGQPVASSQRGGAGTTDLARRADPAHGGIRDLEAYPYGAPPVSPHDRPQQSRLDTIPEGIDATRTRQSVQEQFDTVQKERDGMLNTAVPDSVSFQDDQETSNEDIMQRFKRIEEQRRVDESEVAEKAERRAVATEEESRASETEGEEGSLHGAMHGFDMQSQALEETIEEEQRTRALRHEQQEDMFQRSLREMAQPITDDAVATGAPASAPTGAESTSAVTADDTVHHYAKTGVIGAATGGAVHADIGAAPFASGHTADVSPLQLHAELDGSSGAGLRRMAVDAELVAADYPSTEQVGQLFSNSREVAAMQRQLKQQATRSAGDTLIARTTKYENKKYYLEVSSKDRFFTVFDTNKTNRFQFNVSFSSETLDPLLLARFDHTPWLPPTEEEAARGYRGMPDTVVLSQITDESFAVTAPIQSFDEIRRPERRTAGPNINRTLRNCTDILVNRVQFFATKTTRKADTLQAAFREHPLQYPYILLHIEELGSQYESTDEELRKSFCRLYIDKSWKNVDDTGETYVFIPPNEEKMVLKVPLARIDRLSFRITTPTGNLLSMLTDSARLYQTKITEIVTDPPSTPCGIAVKLHLRNYVPAQCFQVGQTIALEDIEWFHKARFNKAIADWELDPQQPEFVYPFNLGYDTNGNGDQRFSLFRHFLQRPEGHLIVKTERDDGSSPPEGCHLDEFINVIMIAYPYDTDFATGTTSPRSFGFPDDANFEHSSNYKQLLGNDNNDLFNMVLSDATCINGVLHNRTIQTLISLTVNCREEVTGILAENV